HGRLRSFLSSRRRHARFSRDWSSDVCSSDLGIEEVILPVNNERDLRDVPEDVRNSIRFHFVDRMEEVVALALYNGGNGRRPGIRAAASTNEAKKPAAKKSAAGKSAARKRKKPPAKRK